MPDIVLIALGSPDPRFSDGIERLVDEVRDRVRPGRGVGACFLGGSFPGPRDLALELSRAAIAVPVLPAPADDAWAEIGAAVIDLASGGADVRLRLPIHAPGILITPAEAAALADLVVARVSQDARLAS